MQIRVCKPKKRAGKCPEFTKEARMKMKKKNNSEKKLNVKTVNQVRGQKEYLRGEILLSTGKAILNWIVV